MSVKRVEDKPLAKVAAAELPVPGRAYGAGAEPPPSRLLEPLLRRWWLLALCALAALGAAEFYLRRTPPIYEASAQILISENPTQMLPGGATLFPHSEAYLNSQAELIRSSAVVERALKAPGMERIAAGGAGGADFVKGGLSDKIDHSTNIITITFGATDPRLVAPVVNAIVAGYEQYKVTEAEEAVQTVLALLRDEKKKCDDELVAKVRAQQEFSRRSVAQAAQVDEHDVIKQQITKLSEGLATAKVELSKAQLDYDAAVAAGANADSARRFMQNLRFTGMLPPDTRAADARLAVQRIEQELLEYEARGWKPDHPSVRVLRDQLAQIHPEQIEAADDERAYGQYVASLSQKLAAKRQEEKLLDEEYARKQQIMSKTGLDLSDYRRQKSDYDTAVARAEKVCELADERLKNVSMASGGEADTVRVLEGARPPSRPVKPVPWQVFGLAGAFGLLMGAGSALAYDRADQRLRSAHDVASELVVPVLGVVPRMSGRRTIGSRGQEFLLNPNSETSEAIRALRTALYYGMHEQQFKTLVVTSPTGRDGKSTLVSNLGIALAHAESRTLIIDADCRKPVQHTIFSIRQEIGLSDVLNGTALLREAIASTHVRGLHVLPCGATPDRPSESLNSQRFASILKVVSQHYDYVLLDSPPVVSLADAQILGAICDATMLVLRSDKSTRLDSLDARDRLLSVGAQLLGIVINDMKDRRPGGYHAYVHGPAEKRLAGLADPAVYDDPPGGGKEVCGMDVPEEAEDHASQASESNGVGKAKKAHGDGINGSNGTRRSRTKGRHNARE